MSQYTRGITSSSLPSNALTQVTTDSGTASVAANNLNFLGNDTTENNDNGIRSQASGDTVTYELTNRLQGSSSTVGATTADLVTFNAGATPGVYTLEISVSVFESSNPAGATYFIRGGAITDGASATIIGTPDEFVNEDAALAGVDVDLIASGNNLIIRATGDAGLTVNYSTVAKYVFVS